MPGKLLRHLLTTLTVALTIAVPAVPASATTNDAPATVILTRSPTGLRAIRVTAADRVTAGTFARSATTIVASEIDKIFRVTAVDPYRSQQWGMDRLRGEIAWAAADPSKVIVAIADTGVDGRHPDFAGALIPGYDAFDPTTSGAIDPNGHGTHVAGIAAATAGNGAGIAGLASRAQIMPIRVVDAQGVAYGSDLANGLIWAADHGADVINLSLVATENSSVVEAAIKYAQAAGTVVVVAAGNERERNNPKMWPAALPEVITVAATDRSDQAAGFSSTGPWVDVAAPGVDIVSTWPGGGVTSLSGTSMATPFVSGAVALLRGADPTLSVTQIADSLTSTALDLGASGKDDRFGYGLIDPVMALAALPAKAITTAPAPPLVSTPRDSESPSPTPDAPIANDPLPDTQPQSAPATRILADVTNTVAGAVAVSQDAFAAGAARLVVLAQTANFADSLAGAALAGSNGPILYTTAGPDAPMAAQTVVELSRVLQPDGIVYLLGGTNAISERAEAKLNALGFPTMRLAGPSRVETALAVADTITNLAGAPNRVLLARSDDWADAVTGGAWAAATNTPILVTPPNELHPAVAAWLAANNPEVIMLGGTAALSPRVEADLAGYAVTRVSGPTRAATAIAIAKVLWGRTTATNGDAFIIVDGWQTDSWAPALSAATLAARQSAPQLLINRAADEPIDPDTWDYLVSLRYDSRRSATAVLVGPEASLGDRLSNLLG